MNVFLHCVANAFCYKVSFPAITAVACFDWKIDILNKQFYQFITSLIVMRSLASWKNKNPNFKSSHRDCEKPRNSFTVLPVWVYYFDGKQLFPCENSPNFTRIGSNIWQFCLSPHKHYTFTNTPATNI